MRVAFLVESLQMAGAERVVLELAQAGRDESCEACVITLQETQASEGNQDRDVQGFPLFKLGEFRWPRSAIAAARRLRRMLDRLRPGVVAIHTPKAAVIAALAGTTIPALWVLHGHDICWDGATARRRVSRGLQRWALRRLGGHLAAVSDSLADHAASGLGVAREGIAVIPNGVDTERFRFEERTPTDDVVVCMLGRLVPWKGPGQALEAFGWLKKELPSARLWFVGDGPMREELTAVVTARGWGRAVTFCGMQCRPEERLREATVLWAPSESEGLPVACAEAMASGVPVLGYDVRGVRDLLREGCGVLVPLKYAKGLADQTALLVRDHSRYRAVARAARAKAEMQYSLDRMLSNHYGLMRRLCSGESLAAQHAAASAEFGPHEASAGGSRN